MLSFFYLLNLMSPKLNCRPLGKVRYNCWLEWWRGGAGGDTYIYSKKGRVKRRMKKTLKKHSRVSTVEKCSRAKRTIIPWFRTATLLIKRRVSVTNL